MSQNFTRLIDALLDAIAVIRDHFVVGRHVTLSEGLLLALVAVRCIWFLIFGVHIGALTGPLTNEIWTPIFGLLAAGHLFALCFKDFRPRIAVMCAHALLWSTLAILTAMVQIVSPAVPTFMAFALTAVFIAVRMLRDRRHLIQGLPLDMQGGV